MKLTKIDTLLIGFFSFALMVSIYALTNRNSQIKPIKQANEIGLITDISNTVKKKQANMLTWHEAMPNDPVQEDDIIFTSDKSSALLLFKDGSRLSIEGDSLLQLREVKESLGVVLEKGAIQVDNKNKMEIQMTQKNDQTLTIEEDAVFKFSKNNNNAIEINAIKGKAKFFSPYGNNTIEKGQGLNISNGKIRSFVSPIIIEDESLINRNLKLSWRNNSEATRFKILISDNFTFENAKEFSATESSINTPWNDHIAYVKIIGLNSMNRNVQSVTTKIYSAGSEKVQTKKEKDLPTQVINEFNKMLKNSTKK